MHVVKCVRWTKDNRYILSGSDETNIRVWKAHPAEKLGPVGSTGYYQGLEDYGMSF